MLLIAKIFVIANPWSFLVDLGGQPTVKRVWNAAMHMLYNIFVFVKYTIITWADTAFISFY